jgi:hypothetical protein
MAENWAVEQLATGSEPRTKRLNVASVNLRWRPFVMRDAPPNGAPERQRERVGAWWYRPSQRFPFCLPQMCNSSSPATVVAFPR